MEITAQEKHILKHTLGLDYKKAPWRNQFYTDKNTTDYPALERLCSLGLMTKQRDFLDEMSESFVYSCTPEGIVQALVVSQ